MFNMWFQFFFCPITVLSRQRKWWEFVFWCKNCAVAFESQLYKREVVNLCKKKKTDNLSNYDKAPNHVIQFYIYCTTWASKAKYRLTQQESKYYPQNKGCKNYQYCFNKYKLETLLKISWTRLDNLSIHCIGENKFQRKYTIIHWNQYKDEYEIHEFRE